MRSRTTSSEAKSFNLSKHCIRP